MDCRLTSVVVVMVSGRRSLYQSVVATPMMMLETGYQALGVEGVTSVLGELAEIGAMAQNRQENQHNHSHCHSQCYYCYY